MKRDTAMKKITALFLVLLMAVSLTACTGNNAAEETSTVPVTESNASEETSAAETDTDGTEDTETTEETVETTVHEDTADNDRVLVAYFSATGTTEGVAGTIAGVLGADVFEIVPEEPYTDTDLNYNDDNSRSTMEMNDPSARLAISVEVEDMSQYGTVFLGYPIWWGEAPRIVSTFVESYDFSGKTVIPFCTSGGSGLGSSASNLETLTEGAEWLSGERLNGNSTSEEIAEWIQELGVEITAAQ